MTCTELRDHYEPYVIGTATEPRASEIRTHLNRQCEACAQGIQRARDAIARGERRRFGWTVFLAIAFALSLFAAVYFGGRERDLANEMARLREQNDRERTELNSLNQAFAIVTAADATVTAFGAGQPTAKGKVYLSPSQGILLIASGMPATPPGKAYEMWILKDGKATAAGMFQAAPDGHAVHVRRGAMPEADTVAVTMENEAGAPQPTSALLFAAPIRALLQ